MALTYNPTGYTPARRRGSTPNSTGGSVYSVSNGLAQNIFRGDDVKVTLGYIQRCSAITDFAIGVFDGVKYVDPVSKRPTWSTWFQSGVSSYDSVIEAYVIDDPDAVFWLQADASVTIGDLGLNFDITLGAGSQVTGRSGFALKAASRTTAPARVRVRNIAKVPGNAFGDPFPLLEVNWVDQFDARLSAA